MDIDEFLDRELSELDFEGESSEKEPSKAEILTDIKESLGKGDLDQAEQSYIQLWQALMQQKLKWNSQIYEQLLSVSKQLSVTLSQAHQETIRKISHVRDLLSRAKSMTKEGKKDMPLKLYAQMQETLNSIPNIFFEEKKELQQEIMNFYRELSSTMDTDLIKKASANLQQISQAIESINEGIRTGNLDKASSDYLKCIDTFNQIPEGFLQGKHQAGMKLLDIYKTISIHSEIYSLQKQIGVQPSIMAPISSIPQRPTQPVVQLKAIKKPVFRTQTAIIRERYLPSRERYAPKPKPQAKPKAIQKSELPAKERMLAKKIESVKKNIKKGFYNEAWKEVEEALSIDPRSIESKVLAAKIKTLQ